MRRMEYAGFLSSWQPCRQPTAHSINRPQNRTGGLVAGLPALLCAAMRRAKPTRRRARVRLVLFSVVMGVLRVGAPRREPTHTPP